MIAEYSLESYRVQPQVEDVEYFYKRRKGVRGSGISSSVSGMCTYALAQDTGTPVTIDGQGADEQLAGYFAYVFFYLSNLEHPKFWKNCFR